MNKIVYDDSITFNQNGNYLVRPRLNNLMAEAMHYPLVLVCGGAGYGKTQMVHSFLQKYDSYVSWLQVSERDNIPSRFWESYANVVSVSFPEAGAQLHKIGFPETAEAFAQFEGMVREATTIHMHTTMVYDDFHLLHNKVILDFIERAAGVLTSNSSLILISRTAPEFNIIGMMMNESVFIIREDALCFTEEEIADYFSQIAIPATRQNTKDIYDDTHGWAFAVNLIGRSIAKEKKYERYALTAMKNNIFRLIEIEVSQMVSKELWHFLLRVSLIDYLAASLIKTLADDDALVREMVLLNAYIRYDFHLDSYMMHHLFLEYLRQCQMALTEDEKHETYNVAGKWCEENNYLADAISYYEKSGDWDAVLRIVYMTAYQTTPDRARYTLEILDRIPVGFVDQNPLYPMLYLKMKISLGLFDDASILADRFANEYEKKPDSEEKNRGLAEIYGAWADLRLLTSPYTDAYDFDECYAQQHVYFDKNPYTIPDQATKQTIGAYSLLVGDAGAGAPERYIEALSRAIPHVSHVFRGRMYGMDDLARGELHFYRRELREAEQHLKLALDKAQESDQYEIQSLVYYYLLSLSFSRADVKNTADILQSMKALLDAKDYGARYEVHDIVMGHYYLELSQPEQIAEWLKTDFSPHLNPANIENNANLVRAKYHYATRQFGKLLAFLEKMRRSQALLLGRLAFRIIEALSLYQVKQREKAFDAFAEAYQLAEPNRFVVPFTLHGKDMRTLTAATIKNGRNQIPKPWLEMINRKSSAYAKRRSIMTAVYLNENKNDEQHSLTNREVDVLKDLSQGLSRT
ncbi:MAG: hypothetical protein LBH09_01700, partial [Peptococcaceae bacterium]|nr:hypothetical protein [Peptococcaceae bacterium]